MGTRSGAIRRRRRTTRIMTTRRVTIIYIRSVLFVGFVFFTLLVVCLLLALCFLRACLLVAVCVPCAFSVFTSPVSPHLSAVHVALFSRVVCAVRSGWGFVGHSVMATRCAPLFGENEHLILRRHADIFHTGVHSFNSLHVSLQRRGFEHPTVFACLQCHVQRPVTPQF